MSTVTLIDYDIGNLLSVKRALKHIGADYSLARTAKEIASADKLILPGVGAFSSCVDELGKRGFIEVIKEAAKDQKPLFGICVGMQMLFEKSEEFGETQGLGFMEGIVKPIPAIDIYNQPHKIPHIGWTALNSPDDNNSGWSSPILKDIPEGAEVYFVHSFAPIPKNSEDRVADSRYGGHQISSIVSKGNIFGVQFHPEKSGPVGLKILENFIQL